MASMPLDSEDTCEMKHSFYSLLLWEDSYPVHPKIVFSHNGAADTGEHPTVFQRKKQLVPGSALYNKMPGSLHRELPEGIHLQNNYNGQ